MICEPFLHVKQGRETLVAHEGLEKTQKKKTAFLFEFELEGKSLCWKCLG